MAREAVGQKGVKATLPPPPHCTGQTHEQWDKSCTKEVSFCPRATIQKIVRNTRTHNAGLGRTNKTKQTKQKYSEELFNQRRGGDAKHGGKSGIVDVCVEVLKCWAASECVFTRPGNREAASGGGQECRLK